MHRRIGILAATSAALALLACGGGDDPTSPTTPTTTTPIVGSGKVVREVRSVGDFHGVRLVGVGHVVLSPAETPSVVIEADDNLQTYVRAAVVDGVLEVGLETGSYRDYTLVARVAVPAIDRVELTGIGDVEGVLPDGDQLTVNLTGVGSVELRGAADQLTIDASGIGDLHGYDLVSTRCTVRVTGSGTAEVTATETLDASVAGFGAIRYGGNPATVRTTVAGLGSIRPR